MRREDEAGMQTSLVVDACHAMDRLCDNRTIFEVGYYIPDWTALETYHFLYGDSNWMVVVWWKQTWIVQRLIRSRCDL